MYLVWYLTGYLLDLKTRYKERGFLLKLGGLFVGIFVPISLFSLNGVDFQWYYLVRLFFLGVLCLSIQYALKAQRNISHLQLEKEQIQTENYRTQLKAIRAQIDPHFLFNSLNTLRSMVRQQHSHSEKFIISLSDFYRQTLKHNDNNTLPLSEELSVLESYLFLMKNRNEEAVSVDICIDESLHPFHLPSLALQVVTENCFKHNSMTSKMPLQIKIYNTDDYYIAVSNNLQPKLGDPDSSGYGLELLRKRYELMNVPQGILIEHTSTHFTVKLKLIS